MKVFLSSTFRDLVQEREAVLLALRRRHETVIAMEDFLASPAPPKEKALAELRDSDVVVLVLGFRAGSLLPDSTGSTYTRAEYEEAVSLGYDVLVFLKQGEGGQWVNEETSSAKYQALEEFKAAVRETWTQFTNPDNLALAVIQSLDAWDNEGRPGARKTFSSPAQYFAQNAPPFASPILDLSTTMVGRGDEIADLNTFLADSSLSVCVLAGRGGVGKSKLLQEWIGTITGWSVILLRYSPFWHREWEKEIPVGPCLIVVDDAHRPEIAEGVRHIVEEFRARRNRQRLKLLFSTRPGVTSELLRGLRRDIAESEIRELPELRGLTRAQAEELARSILGSRYSNYARDLARMAGDSPLVIVAGGRLLSTGRVDPARLGSDGEFRTAVFDRFIHELGLEGSEFVIDPPRPVLDLIAALGPVDIQNEQFLVGAETFLRATRDKILRTAYALESRGILAKTENVFRVVPDVLSDFILEKSCVASDGASTRYADHLYDVFGDFFFSALMQNLAELDWRVGRGEFGLGLLGGIWRRIEQSLLAGDAGQRYGLLEGLWPASIFQPEQILRIVDLARSNPIADVPEEPWFRFRAGQDYVLRAVPRLLEATAHHFRYLPRSVDVLWDLVQSEDASNNSDQTAKKTLKRLASYELNGWAAFNFAVLLQCVRLCQRPGAFDFLFTPLDMIDQILEREGEFTEWSGNTFRFGGFGLNYAVVGPLRQNAIDFLESLIAGADDRIAVRAVHSLDRLLHQYLNRVGREPTQDELNWQDSERLRCLSILTERLERPPISLPIRSEIYDAVRSGTGANYGEAVRKACVELLPRIDRDSDLAIFDALSRREGDLPILHRDDPAGSWEAQYAALIGEAHTRLGTLDLRARAAKVIGFLKTAHVAKIETKGFAAIIHSFSNDVAFIVTMTDHLIDDDESQRFANELAITLNALHMFAPSEFHRRAKTALTSGPEHFLLAASSALRVYRENATAEDVALIKEFIVVPNPTVKRSVLFAIAYMGRNSIHGDLLDAALSVDIGTDPILADALADAFGPYGVPLSLLTADDFDTLIRKFVPLDDFDAQQGAIPRFLSRATGLFPDQVLDLLLERIQIQDGRRIAHNWGYRALGISHHAVSFSNLSDEKKRLLLQRCLLALTGIQFSTDDVAELFWSIDPQESHWAELIANSLESADSGWASKIENMLLYAPRQDHTYRELRRVARELQPGSDARTTIERWCDAASSRPDLDLGE